jgi:hypothetical protein
VNDKLRRSALVAAVGLAVAGSAPARADEPGRLPLEWNVEDDCPDRAEAESAILEIVGQRAPSDASSDSVTVDIARLPGGRWEARIATHGDSGSGQRRLEGASCERVAEAAILIAAMTIDAVGVAHKAKTTRAAAKRSPDAPLLSAEHPRPVVGVRVPADLGSLPGPTLGLGVFVGVEAGRARVEGQGTIWAPRLALSGPTTGSGGEIGLYAGGVRGCFDAVQVSGGETRFGVCLGGEAGVSTGVAVGIGASTHQKGTWAAGLAGVSLRQVGASGLAFGLSADLGAPIRRPAFVIDNFGVVFQASPVVGRASLDLAWIFP